MLLISKYLIHKRDNTKSNNNVNGYSVKTEDYNMASTDNILSPISKQIEDNNLNNFKSPIK